MGIRISVEICFGNRDVTDDDIRRAEDAALTVLTGRDIDSVYAEFKRQWAEFDDYSLLTGDARLWVDAERAANAALTEGWANPGNALCGLRA